MLLSRTSACRALRPLGTGRYGVSLAKRALSSTPNIPPPLYADDATPLPPGGIAKEIKPAATPDATPSVGAQSLPKAPAAKAIVSSPRTASEKRTDTPVKAEAKIPLPLFMIPGAYHKSRFYGFHVQQPKETPRLPWPLLHEARMRHHVIEPTSAKLLDALVTKMREFKEADRRKRVSKVLDLVVKASKRVSAAKDKRRRSPVVTKANSRVGTTAKARSVSKKGGPLFARKDYQPTEVKNQSTPAVSANLLALANTASDKSTPPPLYPAVSAAEAQAQAEADKAAASDLSDTDYLDVMEEAQEGVTTAQEDDDVDPADQVALAEAAASEHTDAASTPSANLATLSVNAVQSTIEKLGLHEIPPTHVEIEVVRDDLAMADQAQEDEVVHDQITEGLLLDSVKRKRQTKMNKHKRRKRRRELRQSNKSGK